MDFSDSVDVHTYEQEFLFFHPILNFLTIVWLLSHCFYHETFLLISISIMESYFIIYICSSIVFISEYCILLIYPAINYMFKVNNRNTRIRCKICSKLTINTPERCYWPRSGVFIVNFEHISHPSLVFLLLTLNR